MTANAASMSRRTSAAYASRRADNVRSAHAPSIVSGTTFCTSRTVFPEGPQGKHDLLRSYVCNGSEVRMQYAVVLSVDNGGEDPDEGRRGLREELAPAIRQLPGVVSALFMTAYERGAGVAVVVFETREQAEQLAAGFTLGAEIRSGVRVTASGVFEVSASA